MSFFLAIYCDAPHCVASPQRNSAELEMPEDFRNIGYDALEIQQWANSNLASIGWGKEPTGGHLCPECKRREDEGEFMRVCPPAKGARK